MFMVPGSDFVLPLGRRPKYPIGILQVGESMFFPITAKAMRNIARRHTGKFFSIRSVTENGISGARITRVQDKREVERRGRRPRFPLRDLEVGESLYAEGETPGRMQSRWKWMKPKKFKSQTMVKKGVTGVRVWRIA